MLIWIIQFPMTTVCLIYCCELIINFIIIEHKIKVHALLRLSVYAIYL